MIEYKTSSFLSNVLSEARTNENFLNNFHVKLIGATSSISNHFRGCSTYIDGLFKARAWLLFCLFVMENLCLTSGLSRMFGLKPGCAVY